MAPIADQKGLVLPAFSNHNTSIIFSLHKEIQVILETIPMTLENPFIEPMCGA